MKKKLTLLFFSFLFSKIPCKAADWDLFPLNQKSYYHYFDPSFSQKKIDLVVMDSLYNSGGNVVMSFLRKYYGTAYGSCYEQLARFDASPPLMYPDAMEMDSLVMTSDTVRYRGFYFFPNATAGTTWNVHSASMVGGFYDLHITCTSIGVNTILGIQDSIKVFSFSGFNGTVHYSSPFDTLQFILSKQHGLIQYTPFKDLIMHQVISYHYLAGMNNGIISAGFIPPSYLDFIPYHPGDILHWQYVAACSSCVPNTIIYSRDSITSVSLLPDTFSYHYDRTELQSGTVNTYLNLVRQFPVNDMQNVFESPTNWVSFANDYFGVGSGPNPIFLEVYNSNSYTLNITGSDTLVGYSYYLTGNHIDTTTCGLTEWPDATYTLRINNKQGITESCYDSFGPICTTLIGSIIQGDTIGNPELPVGIPEIQKRNMVSIYPNPATDKISVKSNSLSGVFNIEIYDLPGKKVFEKFCEKNSREEIIDVSHLTKGLYFLKVTSDQVFFTTKVIKD